MAIIETTTINKIFRVPTDFHALKDVTMSINEGEFVSIVGKSGCGKSTLLYILSTMDTDFTGDLQMFNESLVGKSSQYLAHLRNKNIGFVFQFHYLLAEFSALENVMVPALKLNEKPYDSIKKDAMEKLELLGLAEIANKRANNLSGGQQQRVAIARALINNPAIIIGDEPTGNLDSENSNIVVQLFKKLAKEQKQTIIIVTHDIDIPTITDRTIQMSDGRIL
jgi:lipoprotein-releasing system ATP-binding protein